jgi:hypothetical protein
LIPSGGWEYFSSPPRPEQLWGLSSLLPSVPGALSLGVKWPWCETDHSPSSTAEEKECMGLYLHSPNTPPWHGAQFKKTQGQHYLYLYVQNILTVGLASIPAFFTEVFYFPDTPVAEVEYAM